MLLSDTLRLPALPLLRAKLNALADTFDSIHVFLYETRSDQFLEGIAPRVVAKATLHNFTVDPFGWLGGSERTVIGELPTWPAESNKNRYRSFLKLRFIAECMQVLYVEPYFSQFFFIA